MNTKWDRELRWSHEGIDPKNCEFWDVLMHCLPHFYACRVQSHDLVLYFKATKAGQKLTRWPNFEFSVEWCCMVPLICQVAFRSLKVVLVVSQWTKLSGNKHFYWSFIRDFMIIEGYWDCVTTSILTAVVPLMRCIWYKILKIYHKVHKKEVGWQSPHIMHMGVIPPNMGILRCAPYTVCTSNNNMNGFVLKYFRPSDSILSRR